MEVIVMSRDAAVKYCKQSHEQKTIMISVSDPYIEYFTEPFCSKYNKVIAIQRLFFCDADRIGKDVYGRDTGEKDLFNKDDAYLIKRLLDEFPNTDVIVHCDAGISRSSGIAAAILKAYTNDDSEIFDNPKYRPNMLCYRTTLNELMGGNENE